MTAIAQNAKIWKGDKRILRYRFTDSHSITNYKFHWSISVDTNASPVLVKTTDGDFTEEGGITIVGNKALVLLNPDDTDDNSSVPAGEYIMELQAYDVYDIPLMSAEGILTVVDPIKKRT